MRIVDVGTGPPIVMIPGIQGRWEWMKPAVDALAMTNRVITFSLADEPTCGGRFDEAAGLSCYVDQIVEAMDVSAVRAAAICGVSYGGLIAAACAARHAERVAKLVLVSALPPTWAPDARVRFYLHAPVLLTPLFCVASLRLYPEMAAASAGLAGGLMMSVRHGLRVLTHPFSPTLMARRVRLLEHSRLGDELKDLRVPTLVITGEHPLDRVVPVQLTHEYLRMWPHAQEATLARTGHLGLITKSREFARLITSFVEARPVHSERRIG